MKTLVVDLTSLDAPSRRRGSGRYVRELALGLSRLDKSELGDLRLIGLTHLELDGSYRVTEELESFEGSPGIPHPTQRDHYHWAYARRFGLFRAMRHLGANAIHLGDPHATPLLMGLTRCRRIVTCHDAIPMHFPERYMGPGDGGPWVGVRIERRRYKSADLVVAISDATLRDVLAIHRVPENRVVRVYNGVDVDRWAAEPGLDSDATLAELGLQGRPFALFVGGYHWHKNVEGMVGAVAEARRRGADMTLVWAGQLSHEHQALVRGIAERAGVPGALELIGYVTDEQVAVLYRAAVAHTLLSRFEGFGLTVVEAMASGCPVVTTHEGSLAEIAGDAAIVVDPDDHAAGGDALVRLAEDQALRTDLGERGRQRAPRFSLDAQASAMAAVYRSFLQV